MQRNVVVTTEVLPSRAVILSPLHLAPKSTLPETSRLAGEDIIRSCLAGLWNYPAALDQLRNTYQSLNHCHLPISRNDLVRSIAAHASWFGNPVVFKANLDISRVEDEARKTFFKGLFLMVGRPKFSDGDVIGLVDDLNYPVLGYNNDQIFRPTIYDPNYFVSQGVHDRNKPKRLWMACVLFANSGAWDMQRLSGEFDARAIDYATVVIGLYFSAAGLMMHECLRIQNFYAAVASKFRGAQMDVLYTHLAARNVFNTKLGYTLFSSGRIGMGSYD